MAVKLCQLTLETAFKLDPKLGVLVKKQLAAVAQDCMNRPHEKTGRNVILEFTCEPVLDPNSGSCDRVDLYVEVKSKVPTFSTSKFPMKPTAGGFLFNEEVPDAIDQPAIPFGEDGDRS